MKHFKERVERDFAATHAPYRYLCPHHGCGFEARDKQGLLRHYTGKHRVIEAYLGQALAERGFVVAPPGGTKRRRSSGHEETPGTSRHEGTASGHEGTSSGHEGTFSGHDGTLNLDKKESPGYQNNPGYPGHKDNEDKKDIPSYPRHISGLPGSNIVYIGHTGSKPTYLSQQRANQVHPAQKRSTPVHPSGQGYRATGVDHNIREGYGAPRVDYNIREAVLKENGRAGSGHPQTIVKRVEEGGRYRMVQGAGYVLPEGLSYGGLRKPTPALPDRHKIKREVEAMMASFGLKVFGETPADTTTPKPSTQPYTTPATQSYANHAPHQYASPSPQEYANPSSQEYISPSQEYVSPQEYIS